MPADLGTERPSVQDPLTKYADQVGWKIISKEDALSLLNAYLPGWEKVLKDRKKRTVRSL